jgi:hypothetical protein
MANTVFGDLYNAVLSGDEGGFERQIVPAGTYDVVVSSARPHSGGKSPMIFITLDVTSGPMAGQKSDVSIIFSDNPNARPFFVRKTKGLVAYQDVLQALQTAGTLDAETGLALIAESFKGKALRAEVSIAGDEAGEKYKGSNNLERTEAISAATPVVQAPQVMAPAAAQPFVGAPVQAAPAEQGATSVSVPF